MKRIFSMAASISIFLILLASCGSYWFSTESLYNSKKLSIKTAANQLANSMALQMSIYQQIVDRLAISPEVNLAFLNADTEQLNNLALKLQALLPGALKIKLLTANMILNQSNLSQLSYGDLEMVKASLTNKQKPVLQGEGQERHLALTATVKKDSEVIGIILVSFPADIAKHVFATNPLNNGFAELKQDQLVITSTGNSMTKQGDSESIAIPNTRWHILLWSDPSIEIEDLGLITSILFLPIILIILIFILCYKNLALL